MQARWEAGTQAYGPPDDVDDSSERQSQYIRCTNITTEVTHCFSVLTKFIAYFEQVHPVYPFLDEAAFEEKATSTRLEASDSTHKTWLALYHTILSLGCMYHDGGSFEPAKGLAWHYFRLAFRHFQDVLMCKATLLKAQVSPTPS
jgi:hypothetical protein